jgi:hypothetical protein
VCVPYSSPPESAVTIKIYVIHRLKVLLGETDGGGGDQRFSRAWRSRSPIPPFWTPSGMTRSLGDEGRLNVYAKRPGSTLMQREKAVQP